MRRSGWVAASVIAFAVAGFEASAGVNVNNGNFYVAYTDFFLPTQGIDIEITRTYNSRSNYVNGYFGVGWSSELEGVVKTVKDTLVYAEGGGGNEIVFAPKGKGRWENGVFGKQTIGKAGEFYELTTVSGKKLHFDTKTGRLRKILDRNKNYVELVYQGGQLAMLRDNQNNQVKFVWGNFGKSPRVTLVERGELKARYEYNAKTGDLVRSSGMDGVPYEFEYDDEHNLTKITYKDGTHKSMNYNKTRDWVTQFRDRDGMVASYDYFSDKLDPENKFGTTVVRWSEKESSKKERSVFWYEFRKRADGGRYNYKAVTAINGISTETVFTECCGTPLAITQWPLAENKVDSSLTWINPPANKRTTYFEYYADGLLKKKTDASGLVTELAYDSVHRKVASVAKAGRRIEYNYDPRGNLAWAYDSIENRRVDLSYDLKGRIGVVKERKKLASGESSRQVFFRYDSAGRPVEVKEKMGNDEATINFRYDNNGQVVGIYNKAGQPITSEKELTAAQRVAATFQNLIEIVQPAGVTLTPEG